MTTLSEILVMSKEDRSKIASLSFPGLLSYKEQRALFTAPYLAALSECTALVDLDLSHICYKVFSHSAFEGLLNALTHCRNLHTIKVGQEFGSYLAVTGKMGKLLAMLPTVCNVEGTLYDNNAKLLAARRLAWRVHAVRSAISQNGRQDISEIAQLVDDYNEPVHEFSLYLRGLQSLSKPEVRAARNFGAAAAAQGLLPALQANKEDSSSNSQGSAKRHKKG